MKASGQILNAALKNLETSKSRFHVLGSQVEGYVANLDYANNRNVMYPDNSISIFTRIFHFCLM